MLSVSGASSNEVKHRISKAWACFWMHKDLLCARHVSVAKRFQLFDRTVTQTVLRGCCSWTLKEEHRQHLRVTYRSMCRQILGRKRPQHNGTSPPESWVDWFRDTTRRAETAAAKSGARSWDETVMKIQWRWLGHVCRRQDGRWSLKSLLWQPFGQRTPGRPEKRWTDNFVYFTRARW